MEPDPGNTGEGRRTTENNKRAIVARSFMPPPLFTGGGGFFFAKHGEMRLRINGKETECSAATLGQLIVELKLQPESLVVEHNAQIIKQQEWGEKTLREGDTIELLNFVGGG